MSSGFDINALLDTLADKVAARLQAGNHGAGPAGAVGAGGGGSPRLLTGEEAAPYLGRTREAVQHMISAGKLPTVRSDRRVFVDVRDLDRWIEDNKQSGIP